jgi:hypothetical protein
VKPYYDDGTVTIYHGDCREILPTLTADAVVTVPMAIRRFRFRWMGMLQEIPEHRWHPTQKPLPVMRWAVGLLPDTARVVLDPYAGSGTTLRAAKDLGRKAIGIEAHERYCEIAAERLGQGVLDFGEAA